MKTPKLYFYDTGLVCHLLGMRHPDDLKMHYLRGGIFESFVISEIKKHYLNLVQVPNLSFWQDKSKIEVDCIIESHQHLTAIEIKSAKTISSDFMDNLKTWEALLPQGTAYNMQLVYAGNLLQHRQHIKVVPWSEILGEDNVD